MVTGKQGLTILRKTLSITRYFMYYRYRYLLSINFIWAIPVKFDGIRYYIRYSGI